MNAIIVNEASAEEVAALVLAAQGWAISTDAVVTKMVSRLSEAAGGIFQSSAS